VRTRLLVLSIVVVAVLVTLGVVGGTIVNDRRRDHPPHDPHRMGDVPVIGLVLVALAVVALGVVLWRRVTRPLADLLDAAERVGAIDTAGPPTPVPTPAGAPRELRELIGTFNEMTARLARTDEERRRFLADVTHELRTPLTVLRSGLEAQLDGVHERDDARLGALLDETAILARLIDDLHTLALTEAGQLRLQRSAVEIGTVVRDAVTSLAPTADGRGVRLVTSGLVAPTASPVVDVDTARLHQVLANLLVNALRHAAPGGAVEVDVDRVVLPTGEAVVRVRVRDDGRGFSADDLAHLFTRYRAAADSGGSGLGLTIARDLVAAHGGRLDVGNRTDRSGAEISVLLPLTG
jgi:signal transduction histidine kinase